MTEERNRLSIHNAQFARETNLLSLEMAITNRDVLKLNRTSTNASVETARSTRTNVQLFVVGPTTEEYPHWCWSNVGLRALDFNIAILRCWARYLQFRALTQDFCYNDLHSVLCTSHFDLLSEHDRSLSVENLGQIQCKEKIEKSREDRSCIKIRYYKRNVRGREVLYRYWQREIEDTRDEPTTVERESK